MIEDLKKFEDLSKEVLNLFRNTILVNLRFMDMALAELEFVPSFESKEISTDGTHLFNAIITAARM